MKAIKRGVVLALYSALLLCTLSGCGSKSSSRAVKLETGDIEENSVVISVGSTAVKYSEVRNYCYLLKQQYEGSFGSGLWDYALSDDMTVEEEVKEEIIGMITQLKVISAAAKKQDVSLDSDAQDEALLKAEEVIGDASAADKEAYCLSVQSLQKLYEENALANKMYYIATDEADTDVSDEEAKQIDIAYLFVKESTEHGSGEDAADKAQTLQEQACKADSFLEFAEENTEDDTVELTIGADSEAIDAAAVEAALVLEEGQVSDVVEGEDGYYILYCVSSYNEEATYSRKEEIIAQRCAALFKEKYAEWLEDCSVNISQSFWSVFTIS